MSAASIRNKQRLVRNAHLPLDPAALAEPIFTINGHEHHGYYCYPRDSLAAGRNGVHVLGPDFFRFESLSTDSVCGVVLKITSHADPCFVTDKEASVVMFVREHPLERQYLLALWIVHQLESLLFLK